MTECQHDWVELDQMHAITKVDKDGNGLNFFPASGIPLVVHVCKKCGELKIFSAKVKGRF